MSHVHTAIALVAALIVGMVAAAPAAAQPPDFEARMREALAADNGDTPEVQALLAGNNPNARDTVLWRTAFMWAIRRNDVAAISRFIESRPPAIAAEPDVTARDKKAQTPLMYACMYGFRFPTERLFAFLLSHGAEIDARGADGRTALSWAVQSSRLDYVQALLEKKAKINAQAVNGWSPLMYAMLNRDARVARLLLDAGADVRAKNDQGDTALHLIAGVPVDSAAETVKLLIEKGSDLAVKDNAGLTVLDVAIQSKNVSVEQLLRRAGATSAVK